MAKSIEPVALLDWRSEHITYRSIWHAAQVLREAGEKDEANGFWSLMAATLLVYTAYEGLVNDVIGRLYPEVWQQEQKYFRAGTYRGTLGKTAFLADRLGVALERSSRPYRTVAELHAWRNDLVHPQTVRDKGTTRADAYAKKPKRVEPVSFAKLARPGFVVRCFEDVSALGDKLLRAAVPAHWAAVRDLGNTSAFWGPVGGGGASLKQ